MTTPGAAAEIETGCAIVGAGPAGLMLGLLLARWGGEVTVVEKHADFLRDFRGDSGDLFQAFKGELVWRTVFQNRAEAPAAIGRYIYGCYNPVRRHSAPGLKSQLQFERPAA